MKRSFSPVLILLLSTSLFACSKSDSPTAPLTVSGVYHGPASDNTGSGLLTLNLSQSGSTVSGTGATSSTTGVIGLSGTVAGTFSGTTLNLTITVTGTELPPCITTFSVTASGVTSSTIAGTYSATSSCGNPISGGTFTLTKQ